MFKRETSSNRTQEEGTKKREGRLACKAGEFIQTIIIIMTNENRKQPLAANIFLCVRVNQKEERNKKSPTTPPIFKEVFFCIGVLNHSFSFMYMTFVQYTRKYDTFVQSL